MQYNNNVLKKNFLLTNHKNSLLFYRKQSKITSVKKKITNGDLVSLHYTCKDLNGKTIDSSYDKDVISFEVGTGNITNNKIYRIFDEAVRGMTFGEEITLQTDGGNWDKNLLFKVPRNHEEIVRLEKRYQKENGLKKDMIVELINNQLALICEIDDEYVILDTNNMAAGNTIIFELKIIDVK